mmetsp:Transcript_21902/g.61241  ORF Transcript_21902/g.61241 Transcript_21902/m.61241 type:complete len:205 (-) Transcript_21902:105-719(-)
MRVHHGATRVDEHLGTEHDIHVGRREFDATPPFEQVVGVLLHLLKHGAALKIQLARRPTQHRVELHEGSLVVLPADALTMPREAATAGLREETLQHAWCHGLLQQTATPWPTGLGHPHGPIVPQSQQGPRVVGIVLRPLQRAPRRGQDAGPSRTLAARGSNGILPARCLVELQPLACSPLLLAPGSGGGGARAAEERLPSRQQR